jgi:hypothetical protein
MKKQLFLRWDKKSLSIVVEEADRHQAVMETIEVKQAEMENQETIPGVTRLRRRNLYHTELEMIDSHQTLKDYIIQLVQKSFRNGKDVADS